VIVAVYGAAGHTAHFVLTEVLRRGHTPVAIGRDEAKLAAAVARCGASVEVKVADVGSPADLDRALSGADAAINCAGPFLDSAEPLARAALRCRMHYFDVTAEQASALSTFEAFDAPARERGVVVAPAVGFYGALGDLLATSAMGDWTRADRIDVAIALDRWWPTLGTRKTGKRNITPRLHLSGSRLTQIEPKAPRSWNFTAPFGMQDVVEVPFTETILIARHLNVRDVRNYLSERSLREVGDPATPEPVAADERGRSQQRFVVEAVVRRDADERRIAAHGRDIYAITAPIVVEAVERVCTGTSGAAGAFALGELVDASDFLRTLVARDDLVLAKSDERRTPTTV
jgi:hypothetical protein